MFLISCGVSLTKKHDDNFFPRDPAKQLVEVKEALYVRLNSIRERRRYSNLPDAFFDEEIWFLEKLLDKMEKS